MKPIYINDEPRYSNRLSDIADKSLFLIFVFSGAAFIVLCKLLRTPVYYIYIVPVCLMVIYAIFCYRSPYFKLRLDKAGDNLYYIGFLYTLSSLGVSLYQAATNENNQEAIISNFGIALITTFCGVAGRVFFTQLRDTPYEVEQETVSSLNETARKLKGELYATLTDFNIFRTAIIQSTIEWEKEWSTQRQAQLEAVAKVIEENISLINLRNKESSQAIKELTDELNSVKNRLSNIDFSKDMLKKQLEGPINELRIFLKEFSDVFNVRLNEIDRSSNSLIDLVEKEKTYADAISRMETQSVKQINISDKLMAKLNTHMDSFSNFIGQQKEKLEGTAANLYNHVDSLSTTYEKLASQAISKQGELHLSYTEIDQHLSQSKGIFIKAVDQQNQLLQKLIIEDLADYSQHLQNCFKEISNYSSSTHQLAENEKALGNIINEFTDHTQQLIQMSQKSMAVYENTLSGFEKKKRTTT